MSKLNAQQRRDLPLEDFGDPKRRLFPIVDQDDVDSAAHLIGKAKDADAVKARIIEIAKRKKLTLPEAWQADDKSTMSDNRLRFSATALRKTGKIFEAGQYPDKNYEMTPEELFSATLDFAPVPIGLDHVPTVLDGKIGTVRSVWLADDGVTLMGDAELAPWIADALGDDELSVSCEWDRASKRLAKLDLVRSPRVSDAALMAAFARHNTSQGQYHLQQLHDVSVVGGATCRRENARMASSHEATAIQGIHDLATEHGARCDAIQDNAAQANIPSVLYNRGGGEKTMKIWELIKNALGGAGEQEIATPPVQMAAPPAPPATVPPAESAEVIALRQQVAAAAALARQQTAAAFADRMIAEKRAVPAERDAICALYRQALEDDATTPAVQFGAGITSRTAALEAHFASRPAHSLTSEMIPGGISGTAVIPNRQQTADPSQPSPERLQQLLGMTEIGKNALNGRDK